MKKGLRRIVNCILAVSMTVGILRCGSAETLTANAATAAEIQEEIDRIQRELEKEYGEISALEAQQDMILEKMEDANAELINTMVSIDMKEEEIAAREEEISVKEGEITEKQNQIVLTAAEYEEAKNREEQQRLDMAARTRMLYEQGDVSYFDLMFEGRGLSDLLNRMDYIEKIYAYSKMQLDDFIETKNQIQDLWDLLEQEKADLEQEKGLLVAERESLQEDKADLDAQKASLDAQLSKLKRESANYDAQIDKARQQAAVSQQLLKQNQEELKRLQTAQTAASGSYSSNYDAIIDKASGSDLGKKIAKFACQHVGNPYVAGGTSLTNGADCSGFTYAVYSYFGYKIPRTSYLQRSAGTGVSYDNAQPGDLICYDGHVAMYIGGGLVVHASNSSPYPRGGIKVNQATYRTILAVRRIL